MCGEISPANGGTKRNFAVYASKIQILSKKCLLQSFFCVKNLHMTNRSWHWRIFSPHKISLERLKLDTSSLGCTLIIASISQWIKNLSLKGAWPVSRDLINFWKKAIVSRKRYEIDSAPCWIFNVYDVVVNKVHVRYLICWWVTCYWLCLHCLVLVLLFLFLLCTTVRS